MSTIEITVILAGAAVIAWINWYFFFAGRGAVAVAGPSGGGKPAEITVVVDGGYSPSNVRAKAGQPLRLVFDRRDSGSCSEEVVFPDFGIRRFLPTGSRTTIELTPPRAGTYEFMCGMSMLRGTLIAEE
jgi:plastocyanin domain-containing protein